jgi:hypothetical protein
LVSSFELCSFLQAKNCLLFDCRVHVSCHVICWYRNVGTLELRKV